MSEVTDHRSVEPEVRPPFSWSYSALNNFETCPRRFKAYFITKEVTEPEGEAIRTGKLIHEAFQRRVAEGLDLPLGMGMHEKLLSKLASADGIIHTEQKLAITEGLKPASWFGPKTWFRSVLDYVALRDDHAVIVDYKTGKPDDNLTQLSLSAAVLFAHQRAVKVIKAALLFVNYDVRERVTYERKDLTSIWSSVLPRVKAMVKARDANDYPAKPGRLCRRYCAVKSCPFNGR